MSVDDWDHIFDKNPFYTGYSESDDGGEMLFLFMILMICFMILITLIVR